MAFTPPSNLKDLVLYWWKIIDRPKIQRDHLVNYISFDLSMFKLNETKKILNEGIKRGYLMENKKKEEIQLAKALKKEFSEWQEEGVKIRQKMLAKLNHTWRENMEITENMVFQVLKDDLIDPKVEESAKKIRSSQIKIESADLSGKIKGKVKDTNDEGNEILYPFVINTENKTIIHKCPMFVQVHREKKNFCRHLARLIMKLYVKNKEETKQILEDIIENKQDWSFQVK